MSVSVPGLKTPALSQADTNKSCYGLNNHGLTNLSNVYWNLSIDALYDEVLFRCEGQVTDDGALVVATGKQTACSLTDRFLVRETTTEDNVWWGRYNNPFAMDMFSSLYQRVLAFLQRRDLFVQDVYSGADSDHRMRVRIITELAWHSVVARTMYAEPIPEIEAKHFVPEFAVISVPSFQAVPEVDGTASSSAIVLNLEQRLCLIVGTAYAGEIKQAVFTAVNYSLMSDGVLPLRCAANMGKNGDTALFFGLSGSGKTALSIDQNRSLVGDDAHAWNDTKIVALEAGGYARAANLSASAQPELLACAKRHGALLENVVCDSATHKPDFSDTSITPNTRVIFPLDFVPHSIADGEAGLPGNVFLLTCDATGVFPPISRLTPEQAVYYFLSGYSSKLPDSGTAGKEPEAVFSPCFAAATSVYHPHRYASMLYGKIERHRVNCWLVNTGWTGGPFGVGQRITIQETRLLLNAVFDGALSQSEFKKDPVFGFEIPQSCAGAPERFLSPADTWIDSKEYHRKRLELAAQFVENFKKLKDGCPANVLTAGPVI